MKAQVRADELVGGDSVGHLPGVVYHGCPGELQGTNLMPSERGTFGAGIYFSDRVCAKLYAEPAGCIVHAALTMRHPLLIDADYNDPQALAMDIETPAAACVRQAVGVEQAELLFAEARKGDPPFHDGVSFGSEIRDALLAQGYDGIIAQYPDHCGEAVREYVVFHSEQVRVLRCEPVQGDPSRKRTSGLVLR